MLADQVSNLNSSGPKPDVLPVTPSANVCFSKTDCKYTAICDSNNFDKEFCFVFNKIINGHNSFDPTH